LTNDNRVNAASRLLEIAQELRCLSRMQIGDPTTAIELVELSERVARIGRKLSGGLASR